MAFSIDRDKCAAWGVRVAEIDDVVATAVGGSQFSEMIEGEKRFDIALRWPAYLRDTVDDILRIPVDIVHDESMADGANGAPLRPEMLGTRIQMPVLTGTTSQEIAGLLPHTPRRRLGDLVTPKIKVPVLSFKFSNARN